MVISLTIRPTNRVLKGSPSTLESPLGSPTILAVKQKVKVPVKKFGKEKIVLKFRHLLTLIDYMYIHIRYGHR